METTLEDTTLDAATPGGTIPDDRLLDDTFAALANPTRRAILARLADGEATVNELAAPFDLTLPAISKHIKVLENAGLIVRRRTAQFRPCAIDPRRLRDVAKWADQYRAIWETRFDQMDDYLGRLQTERDLHGPAPDTDTSGSETP